MGGMNDSNYLDYNPSVLEYKPDMAKKVRINNRTMRKRRKSLIKRIKKQSLRTEESELEFGLEGNSVNSPKNETRLYKKSSLEFGDEDSSDEERDLPLPDDRINNIKIKNDKDFVSFLPLPDAFHQIVTMAEFIKKLGLKKLEEDSEMDFGEFEEADNNHKDENKIKEEEDLFGDFEEHNREEEDNKEDVEIFGDFEEHNGEEENNKEDVDLFGDFEDQEEEKIEENEAEMEFNDFEEKPVQKDFSVFDQLSPKTPPEMIFTQQNTELNLVTNITKVQESPSLNQAQNEIEDKEKIQEVVGQDLDLFDLNHKILGEENLNTKQELKNEKLEKDTEVVNIDDVKGDTDEFVQGEDEEDFQEFEENQPQNDGILIENNEDLFAAFDEIQTENQNEILEENNQRENIEAVNTNEGETIINQNNLNLLDIDHEIQNNSQNFDQEISGEGEPLQNLELNEIIVEENNIMEVKSEIHEGDQHIFEEFHENEPIDNTKGEDFVQQEDLVDQPIIQEIQLESNIELSQENDVNLFGDFEDIEEETPQVKNDDIDEEEEEDMFDGFEEAPVKPQEENSMSEIEEIRKSEIEPKENMGENVDNRDEGEIEEQDLFDNFEENIQEEVLPQISEILQNDENQHVEKIEENSRDEDLFNDFEEKSPVCFIEKIDGGNQNETTEQRVNLTTEENDHKPAEIEVKSSNDEEELFDDFEGNIIEEQQKNDTKVIDDEGEDNEINENDTFEEEVKNEIIGSENEDGEDDLFDDFEEPPQKKDDSLQEIEEKVGIFGEFEQLDKNQEENDSKKEISIEKDSAEQIETQKEVKHTEKEEENLFDEFEEPPQTQPETTLQHKEKLQSEEEDLFDEFEESPQVQPEISLQHKEKLQSEEEDLFDEFEEPPKPAPTLIEKDETDLFEEFEEPSHQESPKSEKEKIVSEEEDLFDEFEEPPKPEKIEVEKGEENDEDLFDEFEEPPVKKNENNEEKNVEEDEDLFDDFQEENVSPSKKTQNFVKNKSGLENSKLSLLKNSINLCQKISSKEKEIEKNEKLSLKKPDFILRIEKKFLFNEEFFKKISEIDMISIKGESEKLNDIYIGYFQYLRKCFLKIFLDSDCSTK